MRLIELTCTCQACPTQWNGRLEDGRVVYIRYRHEELTVEVGPVHGVYVDGGDWTMVFEQADVKETNGRAITIEDVCALAGLEVAPEIRPFRARSLDT